MKFSKQITIFSLLSLIFSCSCCGNVLEMEAMPEVDSFAIEYPEDSIYVRDIPENEGVVNAQNKARMFASIEWTPLENIPSVYSSPYLKGEKHRGIPYSLANVANSYVGLDVSIYTFLTAVNNPASVLYTEDLSAFPYNGSDCAPYYGSVCTASVQYVLGIPALYYARSFGKISGMRKVEAIDIDSLKLCDVLQTSSHVSMIYDICRDDSGKVAVVYVFETTRVGEGDTRIVRYNREGFTEKWMTSGWQIYRYSKLKDNTDVLFSVDRIDEFKSLQFNNDICTSKGDCVSFLVGDTVTLDILNDSYLYINLYKDGELFSRDLAESGTFQYEGLPYGMYRACLSDIYDRRSEYTSFEVIDAEASVDNGWVHFFSRNGIPYYAQLCNEKGSPEYTYIFSHEQIVDGKISVLKNKTYRYCKVHFKGKYSVVTLPSLIIE